MTGHLFVVFYDTLSHLEQQMLQTRTFLIVDNFYLRLISLKNSFIIAANIFICYRHENGNNLFKNKSFQIVRIIENV